MLKLLKPGFFTTLQDSGRFGYRDKGVPVSGVMDAISAKWANRILQNDAQAALLEITMTGPELIFEQSTVFAVTGAEFDMQLNETSITTNMAYKATKGDSVLFGALRKGFRAYLAVKDGFASPEVLGSKSLYVPITLESHFKKNDIIPFKAYKGILPPNQMPFALNSVTAEPVLEVYPGPEYAMLSDRQLAQLFSENWSIAKENDRMAYQLNENLGTHTVSMLTSATLPGTMQYTPSGKLILLMKDGQTTGGYPRILQLTEKAICILAQKRTMEKITFKLMR
ncbi:biotin-dependent carboxyltransferase family protein [Arenibacter sp. GZD96]|uniref:5-oxoprolinase subunit C family protein n=1 Tax=Aurantibrevibacter litoralis TaxID=3106030 RepID=UPI002AFF2419|nr:biotin-dependent carboxyltransferase family protein [Arenibacter sp. GZD-96]MEA1787463.1 biotin-dependent carboxyltransferase family protein [Arenibacter sp. GZD-96]